MRLAYHAASCCWHCHQTLEIDWLAAVDAGAERSVVQTAQRCTYIGEFIAIALHLGVLHRCSLTLACLIFKIIDFTHLRACHSIDWVFPRSYLSEQFSLPGELPGCQGIQ